MNKLIFLLLILSIFIGYTYSVSFSCSSNNINSSYDYVEEYVPSIIEGFGKPSAIIGNSLIVADIENSDTMDLFYHFIRDGSTDSWSQVSISPPENSSLYEVIEIDRVGRDVVLISTDPSFNTIRMVHVYSYNESISDFSFRQSLTHSACMTDSYGLTSLEQSTNIKRLAMGANIIAVSCNATMNQQVIVFWMKHFNGTWVEGETIIDITDEISPLNNTSILMRNDGDLFIVTYPNINQVDVYRRSWFNNLEMYYSHTIYQPDPANVFFGSVVRCRNVFDNQFGSSSYRDYCVICDRAFNSGAGRCWGYRNMLDSPTLINAPIDATTIGYNNFGGEGIAIVDTLDNPHILAVSMRNDYYYYPYSILGAGFSVELFTFNEVTSSYDPLATLYEPALPGPDVVFFGIDMNGSYNTYESYLTVSAVSFASYVPYHNLANRVYIYNVANISCCDKSGSGYDILDTVDACVHVGCLDYYSYGDTPFNISTDDFNYCTTDSCDSSTSEFERIGGVTHEPRNYTDMIPVLNECYVNTTCGEYGWPYVIANPSCPEPPTECRFYCDEYYGTCGLVDYTFGTSCSYGQCNGFGSCFSTQCTDTDECIGLSCEESRSLVWESLAALRANVAICLNGYGVSGNNALLNYYTPMTINMVTTNKTVAEWRQEAQQLIEKHSGPCFDYGCNYWVNDVLPDLQQAYEILDELVGMINCSDAHSRGYHNIECFPNDNGDQWAIAEFEDLTNPNEFPDNDVNDAIMRFRYCIFREHGTNFTMGHWMESHVVAKGSWFSHSVHLTLNGSFVHLYPDITYEYPHFLIDVDHVITTRVYNQNRMPTSRGWIEYDNIVTLINDTASAIQDQSVSNPLRHDRLINTGAGTVRCPNFYTETTIEPVSDTLSPVVSLSVPPLYMALNVLPSKGISVVLPSGTSDPSYNKQDFENLLLGMPTGHIITDSCYYWALENKNVLDVFPDYFDYVTHLKLGGSCGIGCSDWHVNYVNTSMVFMSSVLIDVFGGCY